MRSCFILRFGAGVLALCLSAPLPAQSTARAFAGATPSPMTPGTPPPGHSEQAGLDRLVTIKLGNVPLESALEEVARRAGLTLGYPSAILPRGARVSLQAERRPAGEAMAEVLRGTGLQVRVLPGGQITLVRQANPGPAAAPVQTGTLVGRVTDAASGAPLSGVSIRLGGSPRGTLTGVDGRYRFEQVPAGTHTVGASRIGYAEQSRPATVLVEQTATADFSLALSVVPLDQLVVTGTVVPTELRAVPTPISVVTAEEIQRRNIQRVDQIFRGMVPGAVASDLGPQSHISQIRIRGSTRLLGAPDIKTYIDGVEVSSPAYIANLDPNAIERIEVVRGPQASTIYGSGAIDGVIQIFTKRGRPGTMRPVVSGQSAVGAIERPFGSGLALRNNHSVQVDGGGEAFSYTLGSSYQRIGDWVPEYSSSMPSLHAATRLSHRPLTIDLSARFTRRVMSTAWNIPLREIGYRPWSTPPKELAEINQQTYGVTLAYEVSPRWQHQLVVGYDGHAMDFFNTEARFTTPADSLLNLNSSGSGRVSVRYITAAEFALTSAIGTSLTAGADYFALNQTLVGAFGTSRTEGSLNGRSYFVSRSPSNNTGFFSQVRFDFGDAFSLTTGIRADRHSNFGEDAGTVIAPRIGGSYTHQVGPLAAKLRGSYGEATRPPEVLHQQAFVTGSSRYVLNAALVPERQRGWDAGVDLYAGRRGTLGVTYYDQAVEDLIDLVVLDASAQPRIQQYQNIGQIDNTGWELESRLQVAPPLSLRGTFSRTRSVVQRLSPNYTGDLRVGDQLLGVPRSSAGAALTYSSRLVDLNLEATRFGEWTEVDWLSYYGFIFGGKPYRGSLRAYWIDYPSFTKFNVSVGRRFTPALEGFLRVDNVANNRADERVNVDIPLGRVTTVGLRFRS